MIVVVRTDLNMQKGKIAAQIGHGVLGAFKKAEGFAANRYADDERDLCMWMQNNVPGGRISYKGGPIRIF